MLSPEVRAALKREHDRRAGHVASAETISDAITLAMADRELLVQALLEIFPPHMPAPAECYGIAWDDGSVTIDGAEPFGSTARR